MIDLGPGSFVHAWRDGEWIIIRTKAGGSETTVSLTAEQFEKLRERALKPSSEGAPMADVTGPISTLPGAIHEIPEGAVCDFHPDRPAATRIQGETDSFGCEMYDLCDECAKEDREERRQPNIGDCDWCDRKGVSLTNTRDYEEGMCGRVYGVCQPCLKKYHDDIEREAALYDNGWDED